MPARVDCIDAFIDALWLEYGLTRNTLGCRYGS